MTLPIDPTLVKGEIARRSLKEFMKLFWSYVEPAYEFKDNWHIDVLCDHLANIFEIKNLLITIPPRCTKTLLTGVFFPAWTWANTPETRFFFTSYGLELSLDASVKCRELIQSELYQRLYPNVRIKVDQNAKERFDNTKSGSRLVGSVGGVTTGMGGDILLVDDAHNVKKAQSEVERDNTIRWFQTAFFNRLNDPAHGARIVIGQRVHRQDLAGYIIENYKDEWTHINLPWDYNHNESISIGFPQLNHTDPRNYVGQPLWANRFPESEIKLYKKQRASFETQYNQNPIESADAIFKPETFSYYKATREGYVVGNRTIPKSACYCLTSVDLAIATHNKADYTVIITVDVSPQGDIFVLDMLRDRIQGTKFMPLLVQINRDYQPHRVLLEDVAFQRLVIQQARLLNLPIRAVKPQDHGDKLARSFPLQLRFENRQVHFPKDMPFMAALENELLEFPNGNHDDIVDALAYIGIEVSKRIRNRDEPTEKKQEKTEAEEYMAKVMQGII